jgi:hypothetical protein
VIVKGGAEKKSRALVEGKGRYLPDPTLGSVPLPVTAQLVNSETGVCFEATYDGGDVIENQPEQFKAKAR